MASRLVGGRRLAVLAAFLALSAGCGPPAQPAYQDDRGFSIAPPPGWVERARSDALPDAGRACGRASQGLPLPPLGAAGAARLLVRYDRLTAGRLAWLRVAAADAPSPCTPANFLAPPAADWGAEGDVANLKVGGQPAARRSFRGPWEGQDYINESVAVCKGDRAYLISASFPASDAAGRDEVRRAVAGAAWR